MTGGVAVVVPSAATSDEPVVAVRSMIDTDAPSIAEIVVVVDRRADPSVLDRLAGIDDRVRIIAGWEPFNFSERVNLGVAYTSSAYVLLANDDTEATRPGWLAAMVDVLDAAPDVAVVGAVLAYPDRTVQHAGQVFAGHYPGHRAVGTPLDATGPAPFPDAVECSGVTGALLLTGRHTWDEVGGFSAAFPLNYNDTDFCCKVRRLGGRCVVAPWAGVVHHESRTRDAVVEPAEIEALWRRWWPQLGEERHHPDEAELLVARMRAGAAPGGS